MGPYIIQRVSLFVPTLLLLSVLVFASIRLIPGDPAEALLADSGGGSSVAYEAMRERLGLNQSFLAGYVDWISGIVQGDLGTSLRTGDAVINTFRQRFPVTIELAALSLGMTVVIALPLGVLAAIRAGGAVDYAVRFPSVLLDAIPNFWLAVLAVMIPFQLFGYAPPLNYVPLTEDPVSNLRSLLPPVIVMSLSASAPIIRMTRANVLEVLSEDYMRTAHAKGLGGTYTVFRHALPNAMIPTLEVIVSRIPVLLGGVIVMETVFALPGLGRSMVDAVNWRDYTMLQALVLFSAFLVLFFNLIADLAYSWLDPRVRYDQ